MFLQLVPGDLSATLSRLASRPITRPASLRLKGRPFDFKIIIIINVHIYRTRALLIPNF